MWKALTLVIICSILCGCSFMDKESVKQFPPTGLASIPVWLLTRQYNGVEKDFQGSVSEAEQAITEAVKLSGGYVRYSTSVGNTKTLYARVKKEEHVVIDLDPYPCYPCVTRIDICVGMWGDREKSNYIYSFLQKKATKPMSDIDFLGLRLK